MNATVETFQRYEFTSVSYKFSYFKQITNPQLIFKVKSHVRDSLYIRSKNNKYSVLVLVNALNVYTNNAHKLGMKATQFTPTLYYHIHIL